MIIVLGSVNLDQIGRVSHLPAPGETVSGGGFAVAPGGKGANQALAARRAGAQVRMVGAVGQDGLADAALALLAESGVDLSGVARIAGEHTGVALILVDAAGENVIAVMPGANARVAEAAAAEALRAAGPGDLLLLQHELPEATNRAALTLAKAKGARSLLNIAPWFPERAETAALADVLVANEAEFAALSGGEDLERALLERAAAPQEIVVTLGARGALVLSKGEILRIPALKVEVVDTVGAGDTFCGFLAQALAAGEELAAAAVWASAAAGLACGRRGAQPSVPAAAEARAALKAARRS